MHPLRRPFLIRVARLCWRLLANLNCAGSILRILLSREYVGVWIRSPLFPFRCLFDNYLAQTFSPREATTCFLHHYKRLREALPGPVLKRLLKGEVVLHQVQLQGYKVSLTIGTSKDSSKEGELSLLLKVDEDLVLTLSFTLVPGWVVGLDAEESLLISRLQSASGCYPYHVKLATRALRGGLPRFLLFSALEGIAKGMGISTIAAVLSTCQSSFREKFGEHFANSYDRFFVRQGMKKNAFGFLSTTVPIAEMPLSCIRANHRSTVKRRRMIRNQIRTASARLFSRKISRLPCEMVARPAGREDPPAFVNRFPSTRTRQP